MSSEDVFAGFIAGFIVACLAFLITLNLIDVRGFNAIQHHCEKRGYIQDNNTRILCSVEKKEAK